MVDVHVSERQGWVIVTVVGELDLAAVPRVRPAVLEAVHRASGRVVLDLSGVDFLDSVGLGVVLGGVRRAREADGTARVVVTEGRIRRVFEVTGVDRVVDLHPSLEAALDG